jgi:hypothetical protein
VFDNYFKISDSDFTILINPELDNFQEILDDVTKITYYLLNEIRKKIIGNIILYLSYFDLSTEEKKRKLNNLINTVNDSSEVIIKKRTGIVTDETKTFKGSELVGLIFDGIKITSVNLDESNITPGYSGDYINIMKGKEITNSKRCDIIIKPYRSFWDGTERKDYDIIFYDCNNGNNIIYLSYNDTLYFRKSFIEDIYSSFRLLRAKINFVCIFQENEINAPDNIRGRYFRYNMGGELIDITISKKNNYDLEEIFRDLDKNITKYRGIGIIENFDFYGFNLNYMFIDTYYMIYHQQKYQK